LTLDELRAVAQNKGCYLTMPRKTLPKGAHVRLIGRSGPLGRVCTVNQAECGYEVVACFDGAEVTRWLDEQERAEPKNTTTGTKGRA